MVSRAACALLLAAAAAAPVAPAAQGDAPEAGPHEVKAAFLMHFVSFVEWGSERGAIRLCLIGEDEVTGVLEMLAGRAVRERTLEVLRPDDAAHLGSCDVLYLGGSEGARLAELAAVLGSARGVLTVSDIDGFVDAGGMIELVVDGRRVRFDVNLAAARQSGLRISSKLLRLARRVQESGG